MKINGFKQFLHEGAKKLSIKDAYAEIGKRNIVIEMNSKNSIGNANRFADVIKTKLVNEGFEISECNVGLGEGVIRAFLIFEEPSCFMRNAETCEKELCPVHNGIC